LSALANQTAELSKANDAIREPIRSELKSSVDRADALGAATQPAGGAAAQQQELDALAERFRELSGAAVPIGEQKILLDRTHDTLLEWRHSLGQQYAAIVRHLLVRLIVMGVIVLVVLGISAIWRRATFRYVSDTRRQRQFLLLRRIVVGALIVVILIAGFVAELGTLATFAGLITAGIAVALQTVILSAVAYFFYIGRYGVRVGDRVTVGGVTGDVVDVGLFRLYLMELGGTHLKLKPTGRVAVFSNSVLFAASGFFRQIPGAEYTWHEVALTLAPTGNYQVAEDRLMAAIQAVYAKYREELERQHAAAARAFHVPVPAPEPEARLRFVDAGLEIVVRYPVELRDAAEIDDRVTRALLDAIAREPTLKLVAAGTPTLQPAG
jgi:small-conductance mechanosensitive channel